MRLLWAVRKLGRLGWVTTLSDIGMGRDSLANWSGDGAELAPFQIALSRCDWGTPPAQAETPLTIWKGWGPIQIADRVSNGEKVSIKLRWLESKPLRDPEFQIIREGNAEEARLVFEAMAEKVNGYERLRRHAVTKEETQSWLELQAADYQHMKKRPAARLIKVATGSLRSEETIRRYLV